MKPIWYPLFTVLTLYLAGYVTWRCWPWWGDSFDKWMGFLLGVLSTVLAWIVMMMVAFGIDVFISSHSEQEWRQCWRAKMVSLRSGDGVHGSIYGGIFMMAGHIGSEEFYNYYTLNNDGSFQPQRARVDRETLVFEEDRSDGEVVQFNLHFKNAWVSWFATPSSSLSEHFHIPRGSLKQSFSIQ